MKPLLTIVATAHNEDVHNRAFISSMVTQTDKNFEAIVYHNGYSKQAQEMYNEIDRLQVPWLQYEESDTDTGNWGTANRQIVIDECETQYIIQTSVQDYWLPQAIQYINQVLASHQPDILIWNSINHLVGPCVPLDAKPEWSKIDWGNFAIRTDIAQKVGINHGTEYCADYFFINDVMNSGLIDMNKVIKIPHILTIHN